MLKGKCVKSVIGEFSSSVSICLNKNPQLDLRAPCRGVLPPALFGCA